jgi:hypothetical protein
MGIAYGALDMVPIRRPSDATRTPIARGNTPLTIPILTIRPPGLGGQLGAAAVWRGLASHSWCIVAGQILTAPRFSLLWGHIRVRRSLRWDSLGASLKILAAPQARFSLLCQRPMRGLGSHQRPSLPSGGNSIPRRSLECGPKLINEDLLSSSRERGPLGSTLPVGPRPRLLLILRRTVESHIEHLTKYTTRMVPGPRHALAVRGCRVPSRYPMSRREACSRPGLTITRQLTISVGQPVSEWPLRLLICGKQALAPALTRPLRLPRSL